MLGLKNNDNDYCPVHQEDNDTHIIRSLPLGVVGWFVVLGWRVLLNLPLHGEDEEPSSNCGRS